MPVELESSSAMAVSTVSGEASVSSSGNQVVPPPTATMKKKRNLPGMPDPDAEVIALSPKTLMATNRFVCEICNKGFQRDQNLQLHRRGHNLPWKLRQRSSKEVRKRVYVCPEPSCVHNDPSRALGDLTGIKKHYCRKHGEKKWKCDKCSKKYAVQSDWKAHLKTCGTREYRCDCGTLFSRRDSFITHRAFCDALAEESAKAHPVVNSNSEDDSKSQIVVASLPPPPPAAPPPSSTVVSEVLQIQNPGFTDLPENSSLPGNSNRIINHIPPSTCLNGSIGSGNGGSSSSSSSISSGSNGSTTTSVLASLFASSSAAGTLQADLICAMARSERSTALATVSAAEPTSLCLSSTGGASAIFGTSVGTEHRHYAVPSSPALSATALLQKAAQMGAAATSSSFLRGLGLTSSSSSGQQDGLQWSSGRFESEPGSSMSTMTAGGGGGGGGGGGLGLGLPLTELMMGPSSVFGTKPMTLDLLGLGIGGGGGGGNPTGGFSALMTSMAGGGLDMAAAAATFGGGGSSGGKTWGPESTERKPNRQ
ncbi:zinc finger protein GAI-ASSOCIATED FACTOR 1-like [Macadamia integrifolia]|uniref:zinc finger protein GAI-ASSOCIATED FACTOR 1-like n=1 Tax=Macadamia integrifolia TaxID=60698 RepID=UPI001C4F814E|nr:zinc finger protein GAI-ASSOCIATED FACTOR 1-like [Macadamia integrifolia]